MRGHYDTENRDEAHAGAVGCRDRLQGMGSGKPNCYKSDACFVAACGNDQDAAIIAAAPDLLAACVAALPLLEEYRQRVFTGRIRGDLLSGDYEPTQALRAAIAKAEGRAI